MSDENKLFYTKEELNQIKEKTRGIKQPIVYRHLKVIEILRIYGEEKTRELIEEEIYIFKKSMIIYDLEEYYNAVNGKEKIVADFVFKNRGEVMLTSIHDYIGLGKEFS